MNSSPHFSRHAFKRVMQRTKLTPGEIAEILDRRLAINLGRKPGINKSHLLFYSYLDSCCFVAIQDDMTGTVITVLPVHYHKSLAWEISNADCEKAKDTLFSAPKRRKLSSPEQATVFNISAHFLDLEGRNKTKLLMKIPSGKYNNNPSTLLEDKDAIAKLEHSAIEKGVPNEQAFYISIRHGNNGKPVLFDFQCSSAPYRP